jgi:hypothetical protein
MNQENIMISEPRAGISKSDKVVCSGLFRSNIKNIAFSRDSYAIGQLLASA